MTAHSPYRRADPLGAVVSEHPVTGGQQIVRIVLGLFCLLVAADCIWLGMWPRFGEIHWGACIVTGIIALIFLWLAYDAFAHFVRARRQRVTAHEFGIRIHSEKNLRDVRFDDVMSVGGVLWQTSKEGASSGAVMWLDDTQNQRLELPSPLANTLELGNLIRGATLEKRIAFARDRIAHGDEIRFGRIVLGALMIIVDAQVCSRHDLEYARVSSRWLAVKMVGKREWLIPTETIPNADVLLTLLRG